LPRIPETHFLLSYFNQGQVGLNARNDLDLFRKPVLPPISTPNPAPAILDKSDFLPESLRNPQPALGKKRSTQSLPQLSKKQQKAAKRISVAAKNSTPPLPPVIMESPTPQTSNTPTIVAYSESQSSSLSSDEDEYQDAETSLVMDDHPIPSRSPSPKSKPTTPQTSLPEDIVEEELFLSPLQTVENIDIPDSVRASNKIYFGSIPEPYILNNTAFHSTLPVDGLAAMDLEEELTDMFDERKLSMF
jgi:hypothetical protein